MAIFEDNVSHEDRVSILIYYALMGDDKVLYDEDAGFFKEVMNIINAMDSDSYTLLKSLQVGKCSKTMYNIILTLQEQVCDLAAILDETIGLEDYLDDDYEQEKRMKLDITLTAQRAREMEAEQPTMVEGMVKKALRRVRECVDEDNWERNPGRVRIYAYYEERITPQEWLEVKKRLQELGYNVWFIGTIKDENGNISYKEVDINIARDWDCIISWQEETLDDVLKEVAKNGKLNAFYTFDDSCDSE